MFNILFKNSKTFGDQKKKSSDLHCLGRVDGDEPRWGVGHDVEVGGGGGPHGGGAAVGVHLVVDQPPLLEECVHAHDGAHVARQVAAAGRARHVLGRVQAVRVQHEVTVRHVAVTRWRGLTEIHRERETGGTCPAWSSGTPCSWNNTGDMTRFKCDVRFQNVLHTDPHIYITKPVTTPIKSPPNQSVLPISNKQTKKTHNNSN